MEATKELSPVGKPLAPCKLVGEDGNAFAILGRVKKALKKAGYTKDEVEQYFEEATSGDYDHLLQTSLKYVYDADEED